MNQPTTRPFLKISPFWGKAWIYLLLVAGSAVFLWPFVWMVGTSVKLNREVFEQKAKLWPEAPIARPRSPYVDTRPFGDAQGPQMRELLPLLQERLSRLKYPWPEGLDPAVLQQQACLGCYQRLRSTLPESAWHLPLKDLGALALKQVDRRMLEEVVGQVGRGLLLSQLRARSLDLQEDQLVAPARASQGWKVEGTARASLRPVTQAGEPAALLNYDFSPGNRLELTQTFQTSFPVARLQRLQLYLQGDESWNRLTMWLEKGGVLYRGDFPSILFDDNWAVVTWQEAGEDDLSNKIKDWIVLKPVDRGPRYENGPRKLRIRLQLGGSDPWGAWWDKISRNYLEVAKYMPFWRYIGTSVFLVLLNLAGTLFSCSLVAYSFARLKWPGRNVSFSLMLGTMMVPQQVTMIPFFLIIRKLGWYNTLYPLWVGSFFAGAFYVFLLHQFLKGIPRDLEDAAKIDGCGPLRIYWHIMLPLIKPALATVSIFTFMGVWKDFMGPLVYVSDQRLYPLSLGLYAFNVQAGGEMPMMMAGSFLMALPVVLVFFFAQRYFIEGVTMTGLKG